MAPPFDELTLTRRLVRALPRKPSPLAGYHRQQQEVEMVQGRPDVVLVRDEREPGCRSLRQVFAQTSLPVTTIARGMSALESSPRDVDALMDRGRMTSAVTHRFLRPLVSSGVITLRGTVIADLDLAKIYQPRIWAVEVKLTKWQRSLYQSVQAKSYSNRVYAIFPVESERIVERQKTVFERHGVGLLMFDLSAGSFETVVDAEESEPWSSYDKWYAKLRV